MTIPTQESPSSVDKTSSDKAHLNVTSKASDAIKPDAQAIKKPETPALTLEKWVESVIFPKQDNPTQLALMLSRFGLKNAQDTISFLKTPAGKSELAAISEQNAHNAEIIREQQLAIREHEMRMHQLRAMFLLLFVEKKAHASHQMYDAIQAQIDKILHKDDVKPPVAASNTTHPAYESLLESIASYEKTLVNLNTQQDLAKVKEEALERLLVTLNEIYNESLHEFEHLDTNQLDPKFISQRIEELTKEIDQHAEKVSLAITENKLDAALLMYKHQALHFKKTNFEEASEVCKGEKCYADEHGSQVTSFKKAHFILTLEQKIVKHEEKHYLLKPGQELHLISQEEKELAHTNYLTQKPSLMCIKQQITNAQGNEIAAHKNQVEDTKTQLKENKEEQLLIANMIKLVQSNLANAKHLEKQPQLSPEMAPRPTPTAGAAPTPKPAQTATTQLFRDKIIELRGKDKQLTSRDLHTLASLAPEKDRAALDALLKNAPKINSTAPVPFQTQQSFLKYIEGFGINATKPAVTNIKSPMAKEEKQASFINPNPFKTNPSPFNKTS
jgi:hypothetical protein